MRHLIQLTVALLLAAASLFGQTPVCELFKDLSAANGSQLTVSGELIISKDIAVLGAADCESRRIPGLSAHQQFPTAIHLRPSHSVPPEQIQQFRDAASKADLLRRDGRSISAIGTFSGRLRVAEVGDLPGELIFDSLSELKVEPLPEPGTLPVIPICELFQNLASYRGKRIAVRGEGVGTMEGYWIAGGCKGAFYTDGYRWPVALTYGMPGYYSSSIAPLIQVRPEEPNAVKGYTEFRGWQSVTRSSTYIGRLRMRDHHWATCRIGDYLTNGFGHMGGAAAELIVEAVMDSEIKPQAMDEPDESSDNVAPCYPPDHPARCAAATTLGAAVLSDCLARVREILSKDGIDSVGGGESAALNAAIRLGNRAMVEMLIGAGAPMNPVTMKLWPPLWDAVRPGRIAILKVMLKAGANVDSRDRSGNTSTGSSGIFLPGGHTNPPRRRGGPKYSEQSRRDCAHAGFWVWI
jgi:hypothetical protein